MRFAKQTIQHAGAGISGADGARDACRRILAPIDRALLLFHNRSQLTTHICPAIVERLWREISRLKAFQRIERAPHGGLGYFVAIETALCIWTFRHAEVVRSPDGTCVHLGFRLQVGNAPGLFTQSNGPVKRGGAAIAFDAGMDDQASVPAPN